jgi:hypothetical protein
MPPVIPSVSPPELASSGPKHSNQNPMAIMPAPNQRSAVQTRTTRHQDPELGIAEPYNHRVSALTKTTPSDMRKRRPTEVQTDPNGLPQNVHTNAFGQQVYTDAGKMLLRSNPISLLDEHQTLRSKTAVEPQSALASRVPSAEKLEIAAE